MANPFQLLLPALIPSWRFFEVIEASPRIEYALLSTADLDAADWQEFRPRSQRISIPALLGRLVWNPRWNESLFLVTCAERLIDQPTAHSEDEIFRRIAADLADEGAAEPWLSFRLILVDDDIGRQVAWIAAPRRRTDIAIR